MKMGLEGNYEKKVGLEKDSQGNLFVGNPMGKLGRIIDDPAQEQFHKEAKELLGQLNDIAHRKGHRTSDLVITRLKNRLETLLNQTKKVEKETEKELSQPDSVTEPDPIERFEDEGGGLGEKSLTEQKTPEKPEKVFRTKVRIKKLKNTPVAPLDLDDEMRDRALNQQKAPEEFTEMRAYTERQNVNVKPQEEKTEAGFEIIKNGQLHPDEGSTEDISTQLPKPKRVLVFQKEKTPETNSSERTIPLANTSLTPEKRQEIFNELQKLESLLAENKLSPEKKREAVTQARALYQLLIKENVVQEPSASEKREERQSAGFETIQEGPLHSDEGSNETIEVVPEEPKRKLVFQKNLETTTDQRNRIENEEQAALGALNQSREAYGKLKGEYEKKWQSQEKKLSFKIARRIGKIFGADLGGQNALLVARQRYEHDRERMRHLSLSGITSSEAWVETAITFAEKEIDLVESIASGINPERTGRVRKVLRYWSSMGHIKRLVLTSLVATAAVATTGVGAVAAGTYLGRRAFGGALGIGLGEAYTQQRTAYRQKKYAADRERLKQEVFRTGALTIDEDLARIRKEKIKDERKSVWTRALIMAASGASASAIIESMAESFSGSASDVSTAAHATPAAETPRAAQPIEPLATVPVRPVLPQIIDQTPGQTPHVPTSVGTTQEISRPAIERTPQILDRSSSLITRQLNQELGRIFDTPNIGRSAEWQQLRGRLAVSTISYAPPGVTYTQAEANLQQYMEHLSNRARIAPRPFETTEAFIRRVLTSRAVTGQSITRSI